ncbi:MAG: FKBP-type peptidyl-prolyl cis-trans isomerase [Bacteroidales bacterium]|nr:FKBP-type peptidyl-prolyl cis-trans isomerase [Bacteroidales bacterium]
MKKLLINPFSIVVMVALTSFACSSKFSGFDKTESGLYYKVYSVSEDTVKAKTGDFVSLDMKYTTADDSVLFDSKTGMEGQPIRFQLPPSDFDGDLYEGIRMLSPGDSAEFLINADSLFTITFKAPKRPDFIDSNSFVKFYVTLLSAESMEALQSKEKELLNQYMEANGITTEPLESGLYFIESVTGSGRKIDSGYMVTFHFNLSLTDGSQVFSSLERGETMQLTYGKPFDTPGFDQGIGMMKKGGKAKFIVPSEIAFGAAGRGAIIPPYSTLIYDVEVVDVMTKSEFEKMQADQKKQLEMQQGLTKQEEAGKLNAYLKENNITVKPTASGLYYIETKKGTGARAEPGKRVNVHYTGTLLDGTKFDSSVDRDAPFSFILGKGQVIKGWDEGIALMNAGGKATLIIPSSLAYHNRDMGVIKPYSTLVFEVELIDVE